MGKSSLSRKKKRSRTSSQAGMKKRSKIKSRKHKSKRLRLRDFDDDNSRTSISDSLYSSSSEDSKYRSKRPRLKARKDKKKSSRRRPSYSSESSEDSPHVRKGKGSKRKHDYEDKKKTSSKKKKPRRDASVSSTSSGPTCSGRSISSHVVKHKRHRSNRGKDETAKSLEKVETRAKRKRYRSGSPSCSNGSENSTYQSDEKVLVDAYPSRRLRSVIIVVERDAEGRELIRDEDKEEILYGHDDYPPCRSNDSNDVGIKLGEGDHYIDDDAFGEKIRLENEKGDDAVVSSRGIAKVGDGCKVSDMDSEGVFDESNPSASEFGTINPVNERTSEVSAAEGSVNNVETELVLRQRALENLKKFRNVKQSSMAKGESVKSRLSEEDSTRLVNADSSKEDGANLVASTETRLVKGIKAPEVTKDGTFSTQLDENIPGGNTCRSESVAIAGNSKEKVSAGTRVLHRKWARPALTCESPERLTTRKQSPEHQKPPQEKLSVAESSLTSAAAVTSSTSIQNTDDNGVDTIDGSSSTASEPSCLKSTTGETESDKGSQFENKTMSVMRGGEMVQVSYKVYIPKKAPALARRHLKR
ncbi:hypothetical protein UlMin_028449 [Ulmus minor]